MNKKDSCPACELCGREFGEVTELAAHGKECPEALILEINYTKDPFISWRRAVALERVGRFEDSGLEFKLAAQFFFDLSSREQSASRALFEYSTLMDAFSSAALGRASISIEDFALASDRMSNASEILRSTVHYAFLAPYLAACAILETAKGMKSSDEDLFESYKTANALLEQAKFTLSFRDELHPLMNLIEGLLRYSISNALHNEALNLASESKELSDDKEERSRKVWSEYAYIYKTAGLSEGWIEFFPLRDFNIRLAAPLILAYPEGNLLWLTNTGMHDARIENLGGIPFQNTILPMHSEGFPAGELRKGKIRVEYLDCRTQQMHNEGCITMT